MDIHLMVQGEVGIGKGGVAFIEGLQVGVDGEARFLQCVIQLDDIRTGDKGRSVAARDKVVGMHAEQGRLSGFQRKDAIVLQQHHAFGRDGAGQCGVALQVGPKRGLKVRLPEGNRLHHQLQDLGNRTVQVLHLKAAVFQAGQDMFRLAIGATHEQVAAGMNLQRGVPLSRPVGDHQALVAEVLAQDAGQKAVTLLGIYPVKKVVRSHDGPGGRFAQANLKAAGVQLPQGPGIHPGISVQAVGLLAVGGEMLGRCAGARFLDAVDIGSRYGPAQDGVLRKIFEVPSVQGIAEKVHARAQDDIGPHIQGLFPYPAAHLKSRLPVPGSGHQKASGEAGGEMGLPQAVVPIGLQPYAHGAVHQDDGGDAVLGERVRQAAGSGKARVVPLAGAVETHHQEGLLLRAHRFHDGSNIVLVQLGLGRQARCDKKAAQEECFGFHMDELNLMIWQTEPC